MATSYSLGSYLLLNTDKLDYVVPVIFFIVKILYSINLIQ